MKALVHLLCLFTFLTISANTLPNNISISDNYKVESTFSGNTTGESSFHLIIAKRKDNKTYDIFPYVFEEGKITELKPINFQYQPSVISFHNNKGILSLITKTKDKVFNVIDVDIQNNSHIKSTNIPSEDFSTFVKRKDKNLLIFTNGSSIEIIDVASSKKFKKKTVQPNETSKVFFDNLSWNSLDAINNQDFVANGSIGIFRVYEENNNLYITKDVDKADTTEMLTINLNNYDNAVVGALSFSNGEGRFKKSTSYVSDGKLFQLKLKKKDLNLKIHSLSDENSKSFGSSDFSNLKKADGFEDMNSFLKQAARGINSPTITINKTVNKNMRVRVDYVNNATYNYHYNWWLDHQWFWQWNQQMMQQHRMNEIKQNIPRFGPSVNGDFQGFYSSSKKSYFEFVINQSNDFVKDKTASFYKEINKKDYIDTLDENSKLKHTSSVFTDKKFRYMAYDKKVKAFVVLEKELND